MPEDLEDLDLEVWVDTVHPSRPTDTVVLFDGEVVATGARVTFAVDHRPAQGLVNELEAEGLALAAVPAWAVLGSHLQQVVGQ